MQLEKGVAIPVKRERVNYPYEGMEVGDSFLAAGATLAQMCYQDRKWGKKLGREFTCRKEGDGVRVWRVA